jgi:hypothetical protein
MPLPALPGVQVVPLVSVAVWPLPVLSAAVVPVFSLKRHHASRPFHGLATVTFTVAVAVRFRPLRTV